MENSNELIILLAVFVLFIIYIIRKLQKKPLDLLLFLLKFLRGIRWVLTGIVSFLYFILPVDIIPDILVPFGWIDDIGVFLTAHTVFKFLLLGEKIDRKKEELKEKLKRKRKE